MDTRLVENSSGAVIDGEYRYSLWRIWEHTLPKVTFIMLNPSTADHLTDDPTLRRCVQFAKDWGYGSLEVVNLFAYRATNPNKLREALDPIGKDNDHYILQAVANSEKVILAWGVNGKLFRRDQAVLQLLLHANSTAICTIERTQNGHPRHPLYIAANKVPQPFYE
ncbi:DUF1643 domain-containing protein [Fictibacillus macauensis]|uniref:DUF1643 domain-containing protein n=1 Tax=Fictibacillus macauensis TaxID=245160 RepID=UPI00058F83AF|nr:DUF1643 domain-containing protein [Fictibacillus macauensis]